MIRAGRLCEEAFMTAFIQVSARLRGWVIQRLASSTKSLQGNSSRGGAINSLPSWSFMRLAGSLSTSQAGSCFLFLSRRIYWTPRRSQPYFSDLQGPFQEAFRKPSQIDARIAVLQKWLFHLGSGLRPSYSVPATSILVCTQPEAQVSLFHTCSFEMTLTSAKCKVQRTFHQLYPVVRGRV